MIRSRHFLLFIATTMVASCVLVNTVDAQLFRRNRNCNPCCNYYGVPSYQGNFVANASPTYMMPATSYSQSVYSQPMVSQPVYSQPMNYAMPVQSQGVYAPAMNYNSNCCGSGITYGGVIGQQPIMNPVVDQNYYDPGGVVVDDGRPEDDKPQDFDEPQSCLDVYNACLRNCSACAGAELQACKDYCGCVRNNCPLPLNQQVPCGNPPGCYTGSTGPVGPGGG